MTDLTDVGEFAALFDDHYPRLHRYLSRRVGPDIGADLAQETFAEAIGKRHRFDPARGAAGPWLYGIAHTLLARHRRAEQRQLVAFARSGVDPFARRRQRPCAGSPRCTDVVVWCSVTAP